MKRHAHAILAGHLIGLVCIGLSLPMLLALIGQLVGVVESSFYFPDNPGEMGYLPIILNGIVDFVVGTVGLIFSLDWFLSNAATMLMLVFGVLLMRSRPRWFIRLIARKMS